MECRIRFTVLFENPFWIGLYEHMENETYQACKITFGPEPKDYEVYEFLLQNWDRLRFSPPVKADGRADVRINPKRMQRDIKKQLESTGPGTKSQQALKLQQEQCKLQRKTVSRERKEAEKERQFELKQQKRKEKHTGR